MSNITDDTLDTKGVIMPCPECKREYFVVFSSIGSATDVICPHCGSMPAIVMYSGAARLSGEEQPRGKQLVPMRFALSLGIPAANQKYQSRANLNWRQRLFLWLRKRL